MSPKTQSNLLIANLGVSGFLALWLAVVSAYLVGNNNRISGDISKLAEVSQTLQRNLEIEADNRKTTDKYISDRLGDLEASR